MTTVLEGLAPREDEDTWTEKSEWGRKQPRKTRVKATPLTPYKGGWPTNQEEADRFLTGFRAAGGYEALGRPRP